MTQSSKSCSVRHSTLLCSKQSGVSGDDGIRINLAIWRFGGVLKQSLDPDLCVGDCGEDVIDADDAGAAVVFVGGDDAAAINLSLL